MEKSGRNIFCDGKTVFKRAVFCKPDLDTCLAALILGLGPGSGAPVENVADKAPARYLDDPAVACLECGGAGRVKESNFDHHDCPDPLPPACRQAAEFAAAASKDLLQLIDYVCQVDAGPYPFVPFPSLSSVFSGMLLVEKDPVARFNAGVAMLEVVLDQGRDPFETLDILPEWSLYVREKEKNSRELAADFESASFHRSKVGRKVGFLKSTRFGGAGGLYARGCQVAVLYHPTFGDPPARKYTVAGDGVHVYRVARRLGRIEPGWGGTATIVGSPRTGSRLEPEFVLETVLNCL